MSGIPGDRSDRVASSGFPPQANLRRRRDADNSGASGRRGRRSNDTGNIGHYPATIIERPTPMLVTTLSMLLLSFFANDSVAFMNAQPVLHHQLGGTCRGAMKRNTHCESFGIIIVY